MIFVKSVYLVTKKLPDSEKFGLVQQLNRAAVSIPSNISEGYGRISRSEFARFLLIALGSLREVQTQLELCEMLEYCSCDAELDEADRLAQLIYKLYLSVKPKGKGETS